MVRSMGVTAVLRAGVLRVEPGSEATLEVMVRNTGDIVDQFTISVVGDAAWWAAASPPSVSLFPGAEEVVRVTFRPPRSSKVPAGDVVFGVKVASKEDPDGSVVEESTIEVGEFTDVGADVIPSASQGRKRGRHRVAVDNRGNARAPVSLMGIDENEFLRFNFDPPDFDAEPGTASFAKLRVKAAKGFWLGSMRTHPFQVYVTSEGMEPLAVTATFLQKPRIPRWLPRAILALILLGILGLLAWLFLLKPTIESSARDAAAEEIADEIAAQDEKNASQQAQLNQQAEAIESITGQPLPSPSPITSDNFLGDPFDGRLQVATSPGSSLSSRITTHTVPDGQTLSVADILFQNPDGDSGVVRIFRGTNELMRLRAENFRDLDYHFVSPLRFGSGEQFRLRVDCDAAADGTCTIGIYFSGYLKAS